MLARSLALFVGVPPRLDLTLHRRGVPLDAVNSNGEGIDQVEALGVLGQNRREHPWDNVSEFPVSVDFPEADFWPGLALLSSTGLPVTLKRQYMELNEQVGKIALTLGK